MEDKNGLAAVTAAKEIIHIVSILLAFLLRRVWKHRTVGGRSASSSRRLWHNVTYILALHSFPFLLFLSLLTGECRNSKVRQASTVLLFILVLLFSWYYSAEESWQTGARAMVLCHARKWILVLHLNHHDIPLCLLKSSQGKQQLTKQEHMNYLQIELDCLREHESESRLPSGTIY